MLGALLQCKERVRGATPNTAIQRDAAFSLTVGSYPSLPWDFITHGFLDPSAFPEEFGNPVMDAAFLLTIGSFLLTVELFYLQLAILAFLLTVGAFLLTALASLLTVGVFLLTVGKCV